MSGYVNQDFFTNQIIINERECSNQDLFIVRIVTEMQTYGYTITEKIL